MNINKTTWFAIALCACSTPSVVQRLAAPSGLERVYVEVLGLE